jgi:predicted transposase YdaD
VRDPCRGHAGILPRPAADYLDRPEPLAWGLAALMHPGGQSRAELKLACLRRIARAGLAELPRLVLVNWVETYLQLEPDEAAEYDALRALAGYREVRAMQMTWADKLEAKGEARGRAKGEAEGRAAGKAEGKAQGAREVLLRQLRRRFGPLPAEVEQRLQEVSFLARLTRLADKVLDARSLEEMGLA